MERFARFALALLYVSCLYLRSSALSRYYGVMDEPLKYRPFEQLGGELKALRQRSQESVAEVSGAVEIDIEDLERIESGQERPSEDILMLLITHFGMPDDRAVQLWELAGYEQSQGKDKAQQTDDTLLGRSLVMVMALDTRILYSDNTTVSANKNGLVFNFLQNSMSNQALPIARIGMSYDQAYELLRVLDATLSQTNHFHQPKGLPAPKQHKNKKYNKNS